MDGCLQPVHQRPFLSCAQPYRSLSVERNEPAYCDFQARINRILTPSRRILIPAGNALHGAVALTHQNATTMLALIFLSAALMLIPAFLPGERRLQHTNLNLHSNR